MKLYITIDYKSKKEIAGNIYNKPRKNQEEIYFMFDAVRVSENVFELRVRKIGSLNEYCVELDETIDCSMTAKDILFYVDQRIELLMKSL